MATAACLTLAEAMGDAGIWLRAGRVEDGVFHGATRAHEHDGSIVYVNLRGAHAEAMALRFGETLEITAADGSLSLPFAGYLSRRAMKTCFGTDWYDEHLEGPAALAGLRPFQASTPWILGLEGADLPAGVPVTATRARAGATRWRRTPRTPRSERAAWSAGSPTPRRAPSC